MRKRVTLASDAKTRLDLSALVYFQTCSPEDWCWELKSNVAITSLDYNNTAFSLTLVAQIMGRGRWNFYHFAVAC